MVSLKLESFSLESESDSFATVASNILLNTSFDFSEEELSKRLSGKVLLSIYRASKDGFMGCCHQILSRRLDDETDDWVYDDYLLFFCVAGCLKWKVDDAAGRKITKYRLERSKHDQKALLCLNALDRRPPQGVYDFVAYTFSDQSKSLCETFAESFQNAIITLQSSSKFHVLDRLLSIKTFLRSIEISGIHNQG